MRDGDRASGGHPARRRDIVEAARSIAAESGWPAVTVRAIAARIGCSAPAIYQYFPDKDAVLAVLAEDGRAVLSVILQEAIAGLNGPAKRLRAQIRALWDFAMTNRELYAVMFGLDGVVPHGAAAGRAPEPLRRVVADLAAKRHARETADDLADRIAASAHGFLSLALSGAFPGDSERASHLLGQVVEDIIHGLDRR